MMDLNKILDAYSAELYIDTEAFADKINVDRDIAEKYLKKYWLKDDEYLGNWETVQWEIFQNNIGFPEMVFNNDYELIILSGGVSMIESDYIALQKHMISIGEQHFVFVENKNATDDPPLQMKYPTTISWNELNSGNIISNVLFHSSFKKYYVFGSSGTWGMYVDNEYDYPILILGYIRDTGKIMNDYFRLIMMEWKERVIKFLPNSYIKRVQW